MMDREKRPVLRFICWLFALSAGVVGVATESAAMERTAFVVDADGNINSGVLPASQGSMQLSAIAHFGNHLLGSTMASDGSLLTMVSETDELVKLDLATLEYQVLHTLAVDVVERDDLTFGPTGELLLLHGGWLSPGSSSLFEIDIETGDLTLLAEFDQGFITIEYHQGAYYAGTHPYQFWRIDPETFEPTLIREYDYMLNGPWGLASIGNSLWCGFTIPASVGPPPDLFLPILGVVDPETGDISDQAFLGIIGDNYPLYQTLEIVSREVPVPDLDPVGIVALVMLIGLVGSLAIRRH